MKSTKMSTNRRWHHVRVDPNEEEQLFNDFWNRCGFGFDQSYKNKIRIITQPFQIRSDKLTFDRNIISSENKAQEKFKNRQQEVLSKRINQTRRQFDIKKSPVSKHIPKAIKKQVIVEEPSHMPKVNPHVPRYLRKKVSNAAQVPREMSYKEMFHKRKNVNIKALTGPSILQSVPSHIVQPTSKPK